MPEVPVTRRGDIVDVLHGERVADPYRWLEDTESAETRAWIDAQNAATASYLDNLPDRAAIRDLLAGLWETTRWATPYEHGGRWFFTRHDKGADQPVLRVADTSDGDGRVVLDPNTLSTDGTVALVSWTVSRDGRLVAYATSEAGSDWMTWRVRDVDSTQDLEDVIPWSKWSGAAWLPDSSGFFYGALDAPAPGQEFLATTDGLRPVLHRLGTPVSDDEVVYTEPDPTWEPDLSTADKSRWLVMTMHRGTKRETMIKVLDLQDRASGLRDLVPAPDADARVVAADGTTFLVQTDAGAPRKRLVAIDLDNPSVEHWREIIPQGADQLEEIVRAGSHLIAHTLHDASSRLEVWSLDGQWLRRLELPSYVTVTEISGGETDLIHVGLTSFTDPASVWECNVATGDVRCLHAADLAGGATVVVERASAPSADGTAVPMFLVHREDDAPTGDVKSLLYGYGGFAIPTTPVFNAARLAWVQRGGLLAVANLRGGGEYGSEWYDAGRLANKQNVFDDFAGCAQWLATSGWSRPGRIAINGGSNGGLLVGAVLTQHPDLIGAAVPEVGVMDMLRYHRFTIGWAWTSDYGDPDDPEQYQWVRAFSPLHAVRAGTAYPPTLITTADHDDRVVPGHSFKFAATMQAAQSGSAPVLIRVETAGGHGLGTPVSKLVEARADVLAFIEAALRD